MLTTFKKTAVISLILAPLSLAVGCGKEEEEEEEEEDAAGELAGTWDTACVARDRDGSVESHIRRRAVITGESLIITQSQYPATDTTCGGTPNLIIVEDTTFVVGADVATPAGAKEFDYVYNSFKATLLSQAFVDQFNEGSFCGASDWVLNVEKDVTTASCGGEGSRPNNAPIYDIYDVDGTSLKFGQETDTADRFSAATRPTTLATTEMVFTKVETAE
jgi:hypothetical protein